MILRVFVPDGCKQVKTSPWRPWRPWAVETSKTTSHLEVVDIPTDVNQPADFIGGRADAERVPRASSVMNASSWSQKRHI
mmetsp:Transcript_47376/g.110832  ORF Transcript_47376/g.110832 Transcript_47376/m.110832 type:complete len:80 (-) Transcript_47376:338-577(-)